MIPRSLTIAALISGALLLPAAALASNGTTGTGRAPVGLAVRPAAHGRVILSWDRPAGKTPRAYRILRDGRGAQRVTKPRLTVRPTRRAARYQVAVLYTAGGHGPRSGAVIVQTGHRRPSKPVGAGASDLTDTSVTLTWGASRARRGRRGRIAGYRVLRGGRTVKGVKGTSVRLRRPAGPAPVSYRIVALDTAGWASANSDPITVTARPKAATAVTKPAAGRPGTPGSPAADAVGDTTLSLTWSAPATPAGATLRGYRLMRDGAIVSQVSAPRASVGNLEPKSAHDWSVAAIDATGAVSDPSPATRVVQADPPPTTGASHAFLLASTDASFAAFR
ncbi:MAG: glycoside hydrolase family 18, partial [Conexibacter sp.]|nr:glycoside hydrolase family 18 [Conexibacter sp.]